MKKTWCIPPQANADFVCQMEEVLDLYCLAYEPDYPLVCVDETTKQLLKDVREPLPAQSAKTGATPQEDKPGVPQREDHHYERNGVSSLYMHFEPLGGKRHVKVTDQHTRLDFARCMQELVDVHYPEATRIRIVMDNLSAHKPSALYEVLEPAEARRILSKLEFHRTPKHGSWLNMAEIELSVLSRQCLDRRLGTKEALQYEVAAWEQTRNDAAIKADWQFKTEDARIKLKKLYPSVEQPIK